MNQSKKLSLEELKAKANVIDSKTAFDAVKGGAKLNDCHTVSQ